MRDWHVKHMQDTQDKVIKYLVKVYPMTPPVSIKNYTKDILE